MSKASKILKLAESNATDEVIKSVINAVSDIFVENTWVSSQCANLAFGISLYLSTNHVSHQLFISSDHAHVWVKAGKKLIDADKYGNISYEETNPIEIPLNKRDLFIEKPKDFIDMYGIQLTSKRIKEVLKSLNKHA